MNKVNCILLLVMGGALSAANAEVSSTITVATDYDYRGLTQSARDPAFQASLDWEGKSGFYAGMFGSNVDFGDGTDLELDFYAGYRGDLARDLSFDIGVLQYTYHSSPTNVDFTDIYAGLTYKAVSAKYWYSWDVSNTGMAGSYFEINGTWPLPNDFSLNLHGGYSFGEYWTEEYFDYSIGVTKEIGNFALSLKWVDGSDLRSARGAPDDIFSSDSKLMFTVSTTLPW